MARADVTIRGAGIFGLSVAWACLQRGARVQVFDPRGPGAGSSGGIVGALAPHVPENWNDKKAFQLDSLLMAAEFWSGVERAGGVDPGYARTGRLQPVPDAAALTLARTRAAGAETLWRGEAVWTLTRRPPDFAPVSPTGWHIHDTLTARLHPRRACAALAAALRAGGATVGAEGEDAGAVVWATGWQGLRDLTQALGRTVGDGVKGQAVLLDHAAPEAPQLFVDGLHIVPHGDGTVAVGSTSERAFEAADTTDALCDALVERARVAVPVLAGARELARWAGVRPRARGRAPLLGAWPGRPGHFVANGGFKIGFGMAPKVAQVMADLVLSGEDGGIPAGFGFEAL
jgi:glycine/D-amino acid oxidase-like deaminating enzyme